MRKVLALFAIAALAACGSSGTDAPKYPTKSLYPYAGQEVTEQQACDYLAASEAHYRDMRGKSLSGPYGVSRIEAEKLVKFWAQFCPSGA
ncbi:hypothetical protein SAMN04488075_2879 [Paracoccus alkenifer]|uniref:Uncharacterized protein n=1 Tax=Paracoccus alkenifer TaxID=65735 RepID=A0A1H6NE78_9RHOB|nr:hypothetical protein SAMN04488075_2879 [Paracoccus alkenifer]